MESGLRSRTSAVGGDLGPSSARFSPGPSGTFALRICTQIPCWIAGEKPGEEQVGGDHQVLGR